MNETYPLESTDVEAVHTEPAALEDQGADPTQPDATIPETVPDSTQETAVDLTHPTSPEAVLPYPEELYDDDLDGTQATIYEDFSGSDLSDTEEIVIIECIQATASDIAHASLFSGYLVCGTLVGLAILRKIYGT